MGIAIVGELVGNLSRTLRYLVLTATEKPAPLSQFCKANENPSVDYQKGSCIALGLYYQIKGRKNDNPSSCYQCATVRAELLFCHTASICLANSDNTSLSDISVIIGAISLHLLCGVPLTACSTSCATSANSIAG